ncbi:MAG: hypothetical protein QXU18_11190 [Thermoplasmatales archaeon]
MKASRVVTIVLITLFVLSSTGITSGNAQAALPSHQYPDLVAYVPLTIKNDQQSPVLNGTQVILNVNWSRYSSYLTNNVSNVEFFDGNWSPLYAWMEGNASRNANSSYVWVKLNSGGIGAESQTNIYLGFFNESTNNLSPSGYWGEAPDLSHSYGEYDNGHLVFNSYANFSDYALPNGWSSSNMDYTVSNGIVAQTIYNGIVGSIISSNQYNPENEVLDAFAYFNGLKGSTIEQFIGWKGGSASSGAILGLSDLGNGSQYSLATSSTSRGVIKTSFKGISGGSLSKFQVWSIGTVGSKLAYLSLNYDNEVNLSPYYYSSVSFPYLSSQTTSSFLHIQWIRVRTAPPNGVLPSVYFGTVEKPYHIRFSESGLPFGTDWSVSLDGTNQSSTSSSIIFTVPNGTYSYVVQEKNGFELSPSSSSVVVDGTNVTVPIQFSKLYQVTLAELGLPLGTEWNVTVGNMTLSSVNFTVSTELTNGTYYYSVQNLPYYNCTAPNGTFSVDGKSLTVGFRFVLMVQFIILESGLPTGTQWSVWINGEFYNSTSAIISVNLPNGSYSYVVILPSGYAANPVGGTLNSNNTFAFVSVSSPIGYEIAGSILAAFLAIAIFAYAQRRKAKGRIAKKQIEQKKD